MTQNIHHIDNAIIMAAGFASRFAPLSLDTPKALLTVRGEILIERQIHQLQAAGIREIIVVTGYKHKAFQYLKDWPGVRVLFNEDYQTRNNHSSIWTARSFLSNSYICSSDNYFTENVFAATAKVPFYSTLYSDGPTEEYCLDFDEQERITGVTIGGKDSWYMLGHVFWDAHFSKRFLSILGAEYHLTQTKDKLWETIYMEHLPELTLYLKKYPPGIIYEFDCLEDLCQFDPSYNACQNNNTDKIST